MNGAGLPVSAAAAAAAALGDGGGGGGGGQESHDGELHVADGLFVK